MTNFLLGDCLTRLNNGQRLFFKYVDVKYSRLCLNILLLLYTEGFISGFGIKSSQTIRVFLKYYNNKPLGRFILQSTPGCRKFIKYRELHRYQQSGFISTSKGIMSLHNAESLKLGGELLFLINKS